MTDEAETLFDGDQIAVSAINRRSQDGRRIYVVWTLVDEGEEDQAFQTRLPANSAGEAVAAFERMLAAQRLKDFQWKGPARTKLRRVK